MNAQEKNELYCVFSERLTQLIKQNRIKQKELAALLNITEQTICRYKRGDRMPDSTELYKLANFFGVTIDWLLGGDVSGCETLWKERALAAEQKLAATRNAILLLEKAKDILGKAISSG